MPTLAELCGVELPKAELTGHSPVKVLQSATSPSPHDVLQWRLGDQWAVRQGPWKLLHKPNDQADTPKLAPPDREWFLANMDEDVGERTNLAPRHAEIVQRLHKLAPMGTE
jgi:arylsulfatase A